jgi:ribosomal protein S18 acetylase RimI-like enzyme
MAGIVVRRMRKADLSFVSDLAMLANPHAEKAKYTTHLEEELDSNPELAFVAVKAERVIGYVMGDVHGGYAVLEDIAVDESHQNRGVGSMLLEAELKALKSTDSKIVVAQVHYKCASAIPFYYKHGFRISGVYRNFFGLSHDAVILELILSQME